MSTQSKETFQKSVQLEGRASAQKKDSNTKSKEHLGFISLSFIVISAMVGGGIFNLPQTAANGGSPASLTFAWLITGAGVACIVIMFRLLSRLEPQLKNGLYTYAEHGFGRYVGFLVAYGYWFCNCIATVSYGLLIASTLDTWFLGVFTQGTTWQSVLLISVVIWTIFFLNCKGAHSLSILNMIGTVCKFIPIVIFIIVMLMLFSPQVFSHNFFLAMPIQGEAPSFSSQLSSSLYATIFLFIGIEGAVVVSGQATNQKAVARATTTSFIVTLVIYILVSLVSFGTLGAEQIAALNTPSVASLLNSQIGGGISWIVSAGIIISVSSSWMVWILMLGQMPLYAAKDGVFPKLFARQNKHEAPVPALLVTCVTMEFVLLLLAVIGSGAWDFLVSIAPIIAMPCYLVCALFLIKRSFSITSKKTRAAALLFGFLTVLFTTYVIGCSNAQLAVAVAVLYACGLPVFVWATLHVRRVNGRSEDQNRIAGIFKPGELVLALCIVAVAVIGLALILM